jgi:microcystin-dependent protein
MANNPTLLKMPLAIDGDRATIPETSGSTTGEFSQKFGFQQITSLPLQAGGKAPRREDFNGAFNLLGGVVFYAQKGWTFKYDDTQAYYAGCVVVDSTNGKTYKCINDVAADNGAPSTDTAGTYWQEMPDLLSFFRQPSTMYTYNDVRLAYGLKQPFYLECTAGGTTEGGELSLPSTITTGITITDGTVTWTIRKFANTDDMPTIPDAVPKGIILPYSGQGTPEGYLFCDGSPVSRTTYADLFSAIGTTWGSGNGSTTFNLPNLNEVWLKGSSSSGSSVSAGLPNITGSFTDGRRLCNSVSGAFSPTSIATASFTSGTTGSSTGSSTISFSAKSSNSIYGSSTTVSVSSKTVRYIIKY